MITLYHPSSTFTQHNIPSVSSITSCDLGNSSGSGLIPGEFKAILYIVLWAESCLFTLEGECLFKNTQMMQVTPVRVPNRVTTTIGSAIEIAMILSSTATTTVALTCSISAGRESHMKIHTSYYNIYSAHKLLLVVLILYHAQISTIVML